MHSNRIAHDKFGLKSRNFGLNIKESNYFFLTTVERYCSRAATMDGLCGCGALISNFKPASSTALEVLLPKCANHSSVLLEFWKIIKKAFYAAGGEKTNHIIFDPK